MLGMDIDAALIRTASTNLARCNAYECYGLLVHALPVQTIRCGVLLWGILLTCTTNGLPYVDVAMAWIRSLKIL